MCTPGGRKGRDHVWRLVCYVFTSSCSTGGVSNTNHDHAVRITVFGELRGLSYIRQYL